MKIITVRLPEELHASIRRLSYARMMSMNSLIVRMLMDESGKRTELNIREVITEPLHEPTASDSQA